MNYQKEDNKSKFNILKVIEKKPNSNLIDLSVFETQDDKTNVRVSVLEAFDPLLIKTDELQSIKDAQDISSKTTTDDRGIIFFYYYYFLNKIIILKFKVT